jgi:hypothetical protein
MYNYNAAITGNNNNFYTRYIGSFLLTGLVFTHTFPLKNYLKIIFSAKNLFYLECGQSGAIFSSQQSVDTLTAQTLT